MKIMLLSMPGEGEVLTTVSYYKQPVVWYMPLGILSVASGISPEHDVKILDASSRNLSINETISEIEVYAPDVLGLSVVTRKAYAMAEILRRVKGVVKVVGGPHATYYAKEIIALGADAVFQRDGDCNFGSWLETNLVRGIYKDYIKDIDTLPFPMRKLLNIEDYKVNEQNSKGTLFKKAGIRSTISSSRGCPYRCIFCSVQEEGHRYHSPSYVVDEMQHVLFSGATTIHIFDDCFNVNRNRVLGICNEIKQRGLKIEWSARGRVLIDDETAKALKQAGCIRLHVGIESLDDNVLRWMNKKQTVSQIEHFLKLCHKYGIEILGYFIIGTPVETREYRQCLPDMIHKLGIKYPNIQILYPMDNTVYYQSLIQNGTYKRDYWQDFARNPTANYELPLPRSEELHFELQETLNSYIEDFYGKTSSVTKRG